MGSFVYNSAQQQLPQQTPQSIVNTPVRKFQTGSFFRQNSFKQITQNKQVSIDISQLRDSFDDLNIDDEDVGIKKEVNIRILDSQVRHASNKKNKLDCQFQSLRTKKNSKTHQDPISLSIDRANSLIKANKIQQQQNIGCQKGVKNLNNSQLGCVSFGASNVFYMSNTPLHTDNSQILERQHKDFINSRQTLSPNINRDFNYLRSGRLSVRDDVRQYQSNTQRDSLTLRMPRQKDQSLLLKRDRLNSERNSRLSAGGFMKSDNISADSRSNLDDQFRSFVRLTKDLVNQKKVTTEAFQKLVFSPEEVHRRRSDYLSKQNQMSPCETASCLSQISMNPSQLYQELSIKMREIQNLMPQLEKINDMRKNEQRKQSIAKGIIKDDTNSIQNKPPLLKRKQTNQAKISLKSFLNPQINIQENNYQSNPQSNDASKIDIKSQGTNYATNFTDLSKNVYSERATTSFKKYQPSETLLEDSVQPSNKSSFNYKFQYFKPQESTRLDSVGMTLLDRFDSISSKQLEQQLSYSKENSLARKINLSIYNGKFTDYNTQYASQKLTTWDQIPSQFYPPLYLSIQYLSLHDIILIYVLVLLELQILSYQSISFF
ncbi:UNKNOWN [Stylonychia lemnae]|uniref:Uncharacterized protein n=1 Tax=Stylonychia lemnae TaxID=5949 RepID=A0A078A7P1_STYLE|nr:UNKNOWN [Stylonychia lemnae]|eukprot:CDW77587.1 UNKNOWN [Stylonychia lemnae]